MKTISKKLFTLSVLFMLLMNCTTKENDFFTIDIDSAKEQQLSLSEIAEKVEAIELEMTENSLVNIRNFERIIYTGEHIFVCEHEAIMLFDKTGKFIRQIGSKGQGPGEFSGITRVAVDINNEHLYVLAREKKIICYDFDGKVVNEAPILKSGELNFIFYTNNHLLYLLRTRERVNEDEISQTILYSFDNNLSLSDSIEINKATNNALPFALIIMQGDYIFNDGENSFLYNSNAISEILLDTLYQLKDNRLDPYLKLKFNDADYKNRTLSFDAQNPQKIIEEFDKIVSVNSFYKSSRYVFSTYLHRKINYLFCYDLKSGEGYKFKDGYKDDIHTKENVKIRPINTDANMFYYLHTKIDDSTIDEPNPTLYIGTLKK